MDTQKAIKENIKQNPLAWMVQVVGILVLILNLWLASKLAPMAERINGLNIKVEALEQKDKDFGGWLIRVEGKLDNALSKSQISIK